MARIRVINEFHDKYNFRIEHKLGEEFEVEEERAADLIERKLAEAVSDETSDAVSDEKTKKGRKGAAKKDNQPLGESEKEKSIKEAEEKLNGLV